MSAAIYNEIEPYAAEWMRALVAAGHIAPGVVDGRSITDLSATDVAGPGQRHFFAGIGVWSHALRLAGVPDDASVWTGSCPCQPFSNAGRRGGFDDVRHLWPVWFRLIDQCRPAIVFGEQVASGDGLAWFDAVSADLEGAGYAVGAADLCAAGVGAPHIRQRLFFVAYANDAGPQGRGERRHGADQRAARTGGVVGELADATVTRREPRGRAGGTGDGRDTARVEPGRLRDAGIVGNPSGARGGRDTGAVPRAEAAGESERGRARRVADESFAPGATGGFWHPADWIPCRDGKARPVEPGAFPLVDGAPSRVGRLRAYGNAIVAPVAAEFIRAAIDAINTTAPRAAQGDER